MEMDTREIKARIRSAHSVRGLEMALEDIPQTLTDESPEWPDLEAQVLWIWSKARHKAVDREYLRQFERKYGIALSKAEVSALMGELKVRRGWVGKLNPRDWDHRAPNPDMVHDRTMSWTGSLVDIETRSRWFGSDGAGHSEQLETEPRHERGSNYAGSGPTSSSPGQPGIKGWRHWPFLINVRLGSYGFHVSYGCSIDIYHTPMDSK